MESGRGGSEGPQVHLPPRYFYPWRNEVPTILLRVKCCGPIPPSVRLLPLALPGLDSRNAGPQSPASQIGSPTLLAKSDSHEPTGLGPNLGLGSGKQTAYKSQTLMIRPSTVSCLQRHPSHGFLTAVLDTHISFLCPAQGPGAKWSQVSGMLVIPGLLLRLHVGALPLYTYPALTAVSMVTTAQKHVPPPSEPD